LRGPGPHEAPAVSADNDVKRQIRTAVERIGYQNIARSRLELANLSRLVECGAPAALQEEISVALRELILTAPDDRHGVAAPVREIRKAALEIIKAATHGRLTLYFKGQDLEYLDLYGTNFAFERLRGLSFRGCFLVEASFQGNDLQEASFESACIRNVDFAGTDLTGADFTDADWFNALGLTERQVESVPQDTLMECPASIREMHEFLAARYVFPFKSWAKRVQDDLQAAWADYLRPHGLRDRVARWRAES